MHDTDLGAADKVEEVDKVMLANLAYPVPAIQLEYVLPKKRVVIWEMLEMLICTSSHIKP